MAAQRGRLRWEDDRKIQKNYTFLLSELDGKDLSDIMYSRGIFDQDCLDEIRHATPNTRKARTEVFLDKLMFSGVNGYNVFLEALKRSYPHVIPILEKTDVSSECPGSTDTSPAWYNEIAEKKKQQKLSEQELGRLVQCLGYGWELLAIELGIPQAQIEQAKMANMSPHVHMFNVFNKWKQRQGGNAKLIVFLNALNSIKDKCTIDWDLTKRVVLGET
ncbi:uncharacterized protein LOC121389731 [Gigantopelta aegis]|uniref:uncharacterized protein LOC121389731 n=1 Tax=Gigantopelta aegis TaxID=1735272 RepID=UPI001B88823A|nr:uncharacterized protein LOC121389731 [Gigantopelta aegis]